MELYNYRVKDIVVIDGDTIDVTIDLGFNVCMFSQRIRLVDIDTPEVRMGNGNTEEVKRFGLLVRDQVELLFKELEAQKSQIYLKSTHFQSGKFGRILGDFIWYKDEEEVSLCQWLLDKNYAVSIFKKGGGYKTSLELLMLHQRNYKALN